MIQLKEHTMNNIRFLTPLQTAVCAALTLTAVLGATVPAHAQVAGVASTTTVSVNEFDQLAYGLSVKKSILGKTLYNDAGLKIGKVEDLIIAPDKNVSYLIVGAGGFLGLGRHDVAIPAAQVKQLSGRIVLPGATKESVSSMPQFSYAVDTARRDQLVADAHKDVALAKEKVLDLQKKSATAAGEMKVKLDKDIAVLEQDVKAVEAKLTEMSQAGAGRWKAFEGALKSAVERLKASMQKPTAA
jgi:sporulation protein YlmC with PRC-barrel domain